MQQATQTWQGQPCLGGLYRLYLDGEPGYATALVDRNLRVPDEGAR